MTRYICILFVLPLLFGFGCESPIALDSFEKEDQEKPNILVILSDDQRWDTMQAMPFLSAFMEDGTEFTNAYTTTPLCCPSRASLLSGTYAHNHGVLGNRSPYGFNAFKDESTIATWLHDAGYRTALIGKYLNDYNRSDADYLPPGWDQFIAFINKPGYEEFSLTSHKDGEYQGVTAYTAQDNVYSTDILAQEAVTFLTQTVEGGEQPFFLVFTPFAPHSPSTPPKDYLLSKTFESSPSFNEEDISDKASWMQERELLTTQEQRVIERNKQRIYGALEGLDRNIELILEQLMRSSVLENTIVIYASDNGLHWGEHRIEVGKATPYEEAIHVPFFLFDGRSPQAEQDDRLTLLIDVAPTLASLAGISIPVEVDGRSLFDSSPWREMFLVENFSTEERTPSFTQIHTGATTYIRFEDGEEEMYDLIQDPYELENLVDHPDYASEKQYLQELLSSLEGCAGDECP